jgi:hypothetical protein
MSWSADLDAAVTPVTRRERTWVGELTGARRREQRVTTFLASRLRRATWRMQRPEARAHDRPPAGSGGRDRRGPDSFNLVRHASSRRMTGGGRCHTWLAVVAWRHPCVARHRRPMRSGSSPRRTLIRLAVLEPSIEQIRERERNLPSEKRRPCTRKAGRPPSQPERAARAVDDTIRFPLERTIRATSTSTT